MIKYNKLGCEQMTNILKDVAERNETIEISNDVTLCFDEKGAGYLCHRLEISGSFQCYYITQKMYQKMLEKEIILKVE